MFLGRLQMSWHIQQGQYDLGLNSMFESCRRGLLLCLASFYVGTLFTLQGQKHICHDAFANYRAQKWILFNGLLNLTEYASLSLSECSSQKKKKGGEKKKSFSRPLPNDISSPSGLFKVINSLHHIQAFAQL